jgi:SAM-dependent methyltransferase
VHLNSRLLFERYAAPHVGPSARVLEIGPDGFPSTLQRMFDPAIPRWDTLDLYQDERLTFTAATENTFPVADELYDIVVSANVLEHVRRPSRWIAEAARVCRPGGLIVTVTPVSWPYHEAPIDCWRLYPEGLRALYEDAGLEVMVCKFESIEAPWIRRKVPGRSIDARRPLVRAVARVLGPLGVPMQSAFDSVAVGRKRLAAMTE